MVTAMSRREIERALRKHDCVVARDTGRHRVGLPVRAAQQPAPTALADLARRRRLVDQDAEMSTEGVASMSTYKVTARRWEHGWELHIDGVGVTQARSVKDVDDMVSDYVQLATGDTDVQADVTWDMREVRELAKARNEMERHRRAIADASVKYRGAIKSMQKAGLKGAEIARVTNLSPQRVSQIAASRPDRIAASFTGEKAFGNPRASATRTKKTASRKTTGASKTVTARKATVKKAAARKTGTAATNKTSQTRRRTPSA